MSNRLQTTNTLTADSDATGTLQEHWRKGIPTFILLVLAVVVSSYYSWIVKPGMRDRYSSNVQANLASLGMKHVEAIESNPSSPRSPTDLTASKRIELLKETQLTLRRLVGWNPSKDSVQFQYGIVCNELSNRYLDEAIKNQKEGGQATTVSQFLAQAKNERQNALDTFGRVRKLDGEFSDKASLWLTRRKLDDNFGMPMTELLLIEQSVRDVLQRDSIGSEAKLTLGEILVEKSLRLSSDLDANQRLLLLKEADSLLQSDAAISVAALALQAEARSAFDNAAAKELANKALQKFWSIRDSESPPAATLSAVFRCLLIINSFKEGQVFLSEHLQQLSPVDQPRFRAMTSAAALRHIMAGAISLVVSSSQTNRVAKDANESHVPRGTFGLEAVLSLAIQLDPESNEMLALLEKFATPANEDAIVISLMSEFGLLGPIKSEADNAVSQPRLAATDLGLQAFLNAIVRLASGTENDSAIQSLRAAVKAGPVYGVAASRLAVQMVLSERMSPDVGIRWLRSINSETPELLVAWSDRARLHLKFDQVSEAIQCYEFLLEKLPGNEQIKEALGIARSRL